MKPHILKSFHSLFGVAVLCLGVWSGLAAQPLITVRFADPEYDCASGQYCVGVQFQANEPDHELFGMNVRFFYDVEQLTFSSFTGFQGGYGSPEPPAVNNSAAGVGYNWFGFGSPGTGVAAFVNGVLELQNPNLPPILIPTDDWTELFRICFTVGEIDVDSATYCPPLVWDLEVNPANGGWLPGDQGVVITLVNPSGGTIPAIENVSQFNWMYSGNSTPPYGAPVEETCIDLLCVPVISCPADLTIDCTASSLPQATGEATAAAVCGATNTVVHVDSVSVPPGACDGTLLVRRRWIATNSCDVADTCDQWITITDLFPPGLACPVDVTVDCVADTSPAATGVATATDNCDMNPGVVHTDLVIDPPGDPGYVIERTWTATDECGNSASCLQVITVTNPLTPMLLGSSMDTICSGDLITLQADDPGIPGLTASWAFGSGSDPATAGGLGPHDVMYIHTPENGATGAVVVLTLDVPGCESVADTVATILVVPLPTAGIVVSANQYCVLGSVTFAPNAPEIPGYTYLWDFGDGAQPETATGYGPHIVEYGTEGTKAIELIIRSTGTGALCSDTASTNVTINACNGGIFGSVKLVNGDPIDGVTIKLFADQDLDGLPDNNTAVRTVATVANGNFAMGAILPGHYVLVETQPSGYYSVLDEDASEDQDSVVNADPLDDIIPVTIEPFESDGHNNFVETTTGVVTGYVFDDADENQAPGAGEGIAGVTIELHADADQDGVPDPGGPVQTTTTNTIGFFSLGDVSLGDFVLVEVHPAGYDNILDIDVSNDGDAVANANPADDRIPVTIEPGETDAGNYFIERLSCTLLVTDTGDAGPGTLRYMIDCAQSGDTIMFDPSLAGDTIVLNSVRIDIDKAVFIHSAIMPFLVIRSEIPGAFRILATGSAEFKNLKIISGMDGAPGAAFENLGELTLENVMIFPHPALGEGEYLIHNGSTGLLTIRDNTTLFKE